MITVKDFLSICDNDFEVMLEPIDEDGFYRPEFYRGHIDDILNSDYGDLPIDVFQIQNRGSNITLHIAISEAVLKRVGII